MSSGLTVRYTMAHSPLVWKLVTKVVAEVSERCLSVCSLTWLVDILPTDCQVGRRLLHIYQVSQPTEHLVGTQTNSITYSDT